MPRAFLIKKHGCSGRSPGVPKRPWVGPELESVAVVRATLPVQDFTSDCRGPFDLSVKAKVPDSEKKEKAPIETQSAFSPTSRLAMTLMAPKNPASEYPYHITEARSLDPTDRTIRSAWHRPIPPPYLPFNYPLYSFLDQHGRPDYGLPTGPNCLSTTPLVPPPLVPLSSASPRSNSPRSERFSPYEIAPPPSAPTIRDAASPSVIRETTSSPLSHSVTAYTSGWASDGRDSGLSSSSPSPSSDGESGPKDGAGKRRRPSAPRFQCTDCSKSYSTYSGLSKHRQFHCALQVKKSFNCKYCDKIYVSLGALKMHIRTHTLPCKCKLCGKAFSRPWLLQGHIRTHTGEKPFTCPHCSRAFADRSNLRAHLQTHSDVKKYRCKACSKTFSRMSLLLKHEDGGCPGMAQQR